MIDKYVTLDEIIKSINRKESPYDLYQRIAELEEPKCKTCKYYTGKTGGRMSKTKKYCNRTATINMHPDDFCSRWDKREEITNDT